MRLGDLDALRDWFDDQPDVIATTDVQALIDNWPVVRCQECAKLADCAVPHGYAGYWTGGGIFPAGRVCCSFFERRQP